MDMYVHVRICAFDLLTNAWVHVNRQHHAISVHTCQHWLQRKSSSCVHRQQPVSKHLLQSLSCVHVYMYAHYFIAFDPCICVHVNHQPKPYAMSTITSLDVTIHIACIGMYIHVSISFNPSQHLIQALSMHTYTKVKSSMEMYVHVSICSLDL